MGTLIKRGEFPFIGPLRSVLNTQWTCTSKNKIAHHSPYLYTGGEKEKKVVNLGVVDQVSFSASFDK